LLAAGVLDGPTLIRSADATGPTHDLDNEPLWWAGLPAGAAVEEFVAVRDLELVRPDALGALVALLAVPPLRSAVVAPTLVTRPDGERLRVASYTAWWLSSEPVLGGRKPGELRLSAGDPALEGLYDVAPDDDFDAELLRALGVLESLADADADDVLERLADPDRVVSRAQLRVINRWLSEQLVEPPDLVRAIRAGRVEVVPVDDAVVVDAPDLYELLGERAVVPVAASHAVALAERLDLPVASELADFAVLSVGEVVDDAVVHERLVVHDLDQVECEVAWRLAAGTLHVDASRLAFGLGRGRAWRDGVWSERHRRTEALFDPGAGRIFDDEDDVDDNKE
jgi:hypothetical protein